MRIILILSMLFQLTAPKMPPYRGPSFYPHPPDPQHLQAVPMNVSFERERKFWFVRYKEEVPSAKVRIEQKRPKDGWYLCGYQYLDANGKLVSPVQIDPTWRNPTVILVVLLDNFDKEIAVAEIQSDSKKLLSGEPLTERAVFR